MRFTVVINRKAGAMRTTDIPAFVHHLHEVFALNRHEIDVQTVASRDITRALDSAFAAKQNDAVIVAGGDGTVSSAAARAWKSGKALGVVPAGTMNLFARALKMPLEIDAAANELAKSTIVECDIATANDVPFLHEFSAGFHPRLVRMRERHDYETRLGKIRANIFSLFDTFTRPPSFPIQIEVDGDCRSRRVSCVAVSNNPFGKGHLPYPDRLDQGKLGLYITGPVDSSRGLRIMTDLFLGKWHENPDVEEHAVTELVLHFPKRRRLERAVRDGELVKLEKEVALRVHPGALRVLSPGPASQ